jgi:hypothetical protein
MQHTLCVLRVPRLSKMGAAEVERILGSRDAVSLVEFVARLHSLHDESDHADMRKAVHGLLRRDGVSVPRGKRTNPRMEKLVDCLAPLMLHFGVPLASSERSKLVRALRVFADEYGVPGDPRDELRRLQRRHRRAMQSAEKLVWEELRRAFGDIAKPE